MAGAGAADGRASSAVGSCSSTRSRQSDVGYPDWPRYGAVLLTQTGRLGIEGCAKAVPTVVVLLSLPMLLPQLDHSLARLQPGDRLVICAVFPTQKGRLSIEGRAIIVPTRASLFWTPPLLLPQRNYTLAELESGGCVVTVAALTDTNAQPGCPGL